MKTTARWVSVGVLFVLVAAVWLARRDARGAARTTAELREQVARVQAEADAAVAREKGAGARLRALEAVVNQASGQVVASSAAYESERRTHEPLRDQLERLTAENLRLAQEAAGAAQRWEKTQRSLEERDAQIKALQAEQRENDTRLAELRQQLDRAVEQGQALAQTNQVLAAALEEAWAGRDSRDSAGQALAAELQQALEQLAALSNELANLRAATRAPPASPPPDGSQGR